MGKIKVLDAMTRKPVSISQDATILQCVKIMSKENVSSVIIHEKEILKGIVTERDLVKKVIGENMDPKKTKVSDIMTKKPYTISPSLDIFEAIKIMNNKHVRRLPVLNKGKLVGLLTMRDLLKIQPELISLRVDTIDMREEDRKPSRFQDGECSQCGNFTLIEKVFGENLCEDCKDKKYY